ncbi:MAG: GNAT family N-acetyltransferase [Chloroflexota bacterium]
MPENFQISLETDERNPAVRAVLDGLVEFNTAVVGYDDYTPLHLVVRDEAGTVIGGLLADTYWKWMAIGIFWLRDDLRGQGLGSRLLKMAEDEAIKRGCKHAHLDTLSFQALDFYKKHGYTIFGQLDDLPEGHTRYYLRKTLI